MTRVKQWLILSVAIILFVIGLASVWTPIPAGAVLMTFATFLVVSNSKSGRRLVRRVRERWGWIDRRMVWLEDRSGKTIGRVLRTTRPLDSRIRLREELL